MTPSPPALHKVLVYELWLSIVMVIAPHAQHLPLWVNAMCCALLAWRGYLSYSGNPLPARGLLVLITLASIAGIVLDFHRLFGREVGVTLLMLLASLKLLELRTTRDAIALIYLACFIIITNFFYSQSIPTAVYMLATLLVISTAWVHLQAPDSTFKPRLRIALTLLMQAIPLTLILFVLFPRVSGPLWGLPQDAYASSGLDDKMSPGSLSHLSLSDDIAFRVSYNGKPPSRDAMYWRGPVLWNFDGNTWTTGKTSTVAPPQFDTLSPTINYSVTLEPHNKPWLFTLDVPTAISIPATVSYDFQVVQKEPVKARLRYQASSSLHYHANVEETERNLQRALQLPNGLNPRAQQLAAQWRSSTPDDRALVNTALRYFNRESFQYTLEPPLLGINGVDDFLFTTKQGFCEHYASAFVFLMRAAHLPARVVTGYQGGEFNAYGNYYIVRQSDAHAWAEVWLSGAGWVRIDPTATIAPTRVQSGLSAAVSNNAALPFMARNPPQWLRNLRFNWDAVTHQWNQWVLGYNSERQFDFLNKLGMESVTWQNMVANMMAGLALAIALFAALMLRHLLRSNPDPVQAAWLKLCRRLERAGLPRLPHEAALHYAQRISTLRPELAATLGDLAQRYEALRYGTPSEATEFREFLQRIAAFKTRPV